MKGEKMDEEIKQEEIKQEEIKQEEIKQEEIQEMSLDSQQEVVEDFEAKYNEMKNEYLKVFADFENTKKRLERDKDQALEYAYEKFAKDLLPTLDALNSAKEAAKEHEAISQGIVLVMENLLKTLEKYGISEIPTDGDFDPNLHDGIMQMPNPDLQDGQIAQVMQKGYRYKERTLRPAMVAIVKN